jgi:outer membrane protein assembly factor BamD
MQHRNFRVLLLSAFLVLSWGLASFAQVTGEGTPTQRLEVLRSKLDLMRRALDSALASMNAKDSGNKGEKMEADDPRIRLRGLEKEVSSVSKDVGDLRAKVDRADKIDQRDIDKLETSVTDLNTRVQQGLSATAGARNMSTTTAAASTDKQSSNNKKKKGKFLGIFGGGGDDEKYAELTDTVAPGRDRQLFEVAAKEVRKSNYDTGRLLFNTIITTYPESPFLSMSKLAIADSFYLEGSTSALIQSSQAYQDWLTFFPTHMLSDRVMLKLAEAEIRQMGLSDRDTTRARKAEQRLKAILQQFPNTTLKGKVQEYLALVQENLGLHSLQVARFYQDRYEHGNGGLKGAQGRLREILEKYPYFSYTDEVLFRQGWLYVQEEEPDEAVKYFTRVVRDFPNGDFVEKAKEELQKIGAPIPDPDPIAANNHPKPERPGMMGSLLQQISGSANIDVDNSGVLIGRGEKKADLIDEVIANQGEIHSLAPADVQQRRQGPRTFQQGTTPVPTKSPSQPTPAPTGQPSTTPATTTPSNLTGTKP